MPKRIALLTVIATLTLTAVAWALNGIGWPSPGSEECTTTHHCYAIEQTFGTINEAGIVATPMQHVGIPAGGFTDWELWVEFGTPGEWIEHGLEWTGETPAYREFYAEKKSGEWYVHRGPVVNFTFLGLTDPAGNGCWQVVSGYDYNAHPPRWYVDSGQFCGWPATGTEAQAGGETASNTQPSISGAVSEWMNGNFTGGWPYATPYHNPAIELFASPKWPYTPGGIEWATPGTKREAAPVVADSTAPFAVTEGKMVVYKCACTAKGASVRPGEKPPTGHYRALIRDSEKHIIDEYVGNTVPNEARVRKGGAE